MISVHGVHMEESTLMVKDLVICNNLQTGINSIILDIRTKKLNIKKANHVYCKSSILYQIRNCEKICKGFVLWPRNYMAASSWKRILCG